MCKIEEIDVYGYSGIKMVNDQLEAWLIPAWGSNLIRLKLRESDTELLRNPNSLNEYMEQPMLYGIPILFPPNRIANGTFSFHQSTYHFDVNEPERNNHLHGFVFNRPWQLLSAEVNGHRIEVRTMFDSTLHPDVVRQFPHPFTIVMYYELEGSKLSMNATIVNHGNTPFPWGLGYHTTFTIPMRPFVYDSGGSTLYIPVSHHWELTEQLVPTGRLMTSALVTALNEGICPSDYALDDVFLSSVTGDVNMAILEDGVNGVVLKYTCDSQFTQWVIYNDDGRQGYVSIEPYTWVTNAPNLSLPHSLTGLQVLNPGEKVILNSSIEVGRREK